MLELLVISGKGGTGKTSLTAAFAHLAQNKVICDLDVDAPDLHLLLQPKVGQTTEFRSGNEAIIDPERCTDCGTCMELCRYQAVSRGADGPVIDPLRCEGCKVCVHFCPEGAIDFPERHCGNWYLSQTRFGPMVHAQLFPGQENSGRLVALLRQQARALATESGLDMILCDGTPGIGCPVISSLSGVNLAVVVTEPTPSGRHDMERVLELCAHFKVPPLVVINKYDLNPDQSRRIEEFCARNHLEMAGRLPHDPAMTQAMVQGRTITEWGQGELAGQVRRIWQEINERAARLKAA